MKNIQTIRQIARKNSRGFTLVELMIVVAIIGVLAALAVYGVSRYVANAKTAEARGSVGAMAKGQMAYFNGESMAGTNLALGSTVGTTHKLCPTMGTTVVPAVASIKGQKYQSTPADWDTAAFKCLNFNMEAPQYFAYGFVSTMAGTVAAANDTFVASANGDLDGDDALSTFSLGGTVRADATTGQLVLALDPAITEANPTE